MQTLAAMGMQWTTRAIGAAAVSSVSSLRLVAAVVGSVVLLHETPTHPLVWSGFVVVVLTMAAYTAFQYKGQRSNQAVETANHQQAEPPGTTSSSNCAGQLAAAAATGDLGCHYDCSLQEEGRRSALLASVVASDALWQLFVPLVLLDRPRSATQQKPGRSKSLPVFVHQQAAQRAGSGRDVDGQQQRWHVSESEVGKVQRQIPGAEMPQQCRIALPCACPGC